MKWVSVHHGAYLVSDGGLVQRALPAKGARVGGLVRRFVDPNGYARVCLSLRSKVTWVWLHRLVAGAFIGPCPAGKQVNHRDGDKLNNAIGNLEYVTPSENMRHAIRMGLRKPTQSSRPGERNPSARLTENDVISLRKAYADGETCTSIAARYGISKSAAHHAATRHTWRHVP